MNLAFDAGKAEKFRFRVSLNGRVFGCSRARVADGWVELVRLDPDRLLGSVRLPSDGERFESFLGGAGEALVRLEDGDTGEHVEFAVSGITYAYPTYNTYNEVPLQYLRGHAHATRTA